MQAPRPPCPQLQGGVLQPAATHAAKAAAIAISMVDAKPSNCVSQPGGQTPRGEILHLRHRRRTGIGGDISIPSSNSSARTAGRRGACAITCEIYSVGDVVDQTNAIALSCSLASN